MQSSGEAERSARCGCGGAARMLAPMTSRRKVPGNTKTLEIVPFLLRGDQRRLVSCVPAETELCQLSRHL